MRVFSQFSAAIGLIILLMIAGCSDDGGAAVEPGTSTDSADSTESADNTDGTTGVDNADGNTATDQTDGADDTTNSTVPDGSDGSDTSTETDVTDVTDGAESSDGDDDTDTTGTDGNTSSELCIADGTCDAENGETIENCPDDCTCGNGVCDADETSDSCPDDCKCGNGVCDEGEDTANCAEDCTCGDGVCDADKGEDSTTCALDCSCDAVSGCAQEPTQPVCCNGEEFFPNFCYAQCALDNAFDVCGPYNPETCAVVVECPDPACNPAWVDQQPVCWQSGAQSQSYQNPYEACCDGHNWLTDADVFPGECGGGSNFSCAAANACPPTERLVCGTLDSAPHTFQNLCDFSLCADDTGTGPVLECDAPCGEWYECPACADDNACNLVCGADGTTYRNSCYAACAGVQVESQGECCDCPEPSGVEQICGDDGVTYGSECLLGCADGVLPGYIGPCVTGCSPEPDDLPACGFFDGKFITFANSECAQAAGATCVYDGECAPGTFNPCPLSDPYYDPVCAAVPGGQTESYANECFAGCAGATVQYGGLCEECTTSPTLCPPEALDDTQPTCVVEECVLYPNECYPKKCTGNAEATLQKFGCPQDCGAVQE